MGRCIVYTGIRLLLHFCPFISSFFFLSNFQTLKFFVTLFSGTARPRRLKLGTHMDSGQMYRVYKSGCCCLFIPLFFHFSFCPIYYQTLKIFVTFLSETVRSRRVKLGRHMDSGQMYHVYPNQAAAAAYLSLYFFIFLSLQFSNIKIFRHTFLTNCEA